MKDIQIVQPLYANAKGDAMVNRTSQLCTTPEGALAMQIEWQRLLFKKRGIFVFAREALQARVLTESEVRQYAKWGGWSMGMERIPAAGGLPRLIAGWVGQTAHTGIGLNGIIITYNNPQGHAACVVVIGEPSVIAEIEHSIPEQRILKPETSDSRKPS